MRWSTSVNCYDTNYAALVIIQLLLLQKMEEPFLYAVKLTLEDRYTDNMDAVYRVVIKLILETMEKACQKALAEKS